MNRTAIIIASLLLFAACKDKAGTAGAGTGEWGIFRGNASLDACTDVPLPASPRLLWAFKSGAYTKSSPVVYNQVAYWSDRRGHIFGVNTEGKQVFDYALETAVEASPAIYDSTLYVGRIDGRLTALSLNSQEVLWNFETFGQIAASPNRISPGGRDAIVVGSYDHYLYCIDAKSGAEISRYPSGYYINGAVAQHGNLIAYGGCDGWFRVVDGMSGIQTDSLEVDAYIPASPAIRDGHCYIADYAGNIYDIELDRGEIASSRKIIESQDENRTFVSVPAVSDRMLYIVSDDRHLYAINRKDASITWKALLKGATGESSPVICRDRLLVCTKTGIVSIHDASTGRLLWEYDTGEQILASPAVINGYFYILTFKGTLFCFGE